MGRAAAGWTRFQMADSRCFSAFQFSRSQIGRSFAWLTVLSSAILRSQEIRAMPAFRSAVYTVATVCLVTTAAAQSSCSASGHCSGSRRHHLSYVHQPYAGTFGFGYGYRPTIDLDTAIVRRTPRATFAAKLIWYDHKAWRICSTRKPGRRLKKHAHATLKTVFWP